jgi:hypothetical protein
VSERGEAGGEGAAGPQCGQVVCRRSFGWDCRAGPGPGPGPGRRWPAADWRGGGTEQSLPDSVSEITRLGQPGSGRALDGPGAGSLARPLGLPLGLGELV